jgi:hypothetical protein
MDMRNETMTEARREWDGQWAEWRLGAARREWDRQWAELRTRDAEFLDFRGDSDNAEFFADAPAEVVYAMTKGGAL